MLQKFRYFLAEFSQGSYSLGCLNSAQFMGAINDNLFKLSLVYMLIENLGASEASEILATVSGIYVLPFLLFSSFGGKLADHFSKQRLIFFMKVAEMIIILLAMVSFALKSVWASYTLFFLLSSHSALFSPSKYGIIPELVSNDNISRANGLITGFTYFAVILGTFLASFLTDVTDHNFVLVLGCCFFFSFIGFVSSLGISCTPPQNQELKPNFFFLKEIYHTLLEVRTVRHLLTALIASSIFLLIGAFIQLNIIPFAIQSLGLTDVAGGYIFLCVAMGIGVGSFIAGKISKKHPKILLPCFAGLCNGALLLLISSKFASLPVLIVLLVLVGICGGLFVVPFDSFIQLSAPSEKRGKIIAAGSFLSFFGVLLASLMLYVFSELLELSAAESFALMGIVTILMSLVLMARLSDLALPLIARTFLKPFFHPIPHQLELYAKTSPQLLILNEPSWFKLLMLLTLIPDLRILLSPEPRRRFPWINGLCETVHCIPADKLVEKAQLYLEKGDKVCLFAPPIPISPSIPFLFVTVTRSPSPDVHITFSKSPS